MSAPTRAVPKDARRRIILDAARTLVAAKGAPALNMRDIAREAGVALGTIYLSFPSRTDLLAVLLVERYDALLDDLQQMTPSGSVAADLSSVTPLVAGVMGLRDQVAGWETPAGGVTETNRRDLADREARVRSAVHNLLSASVRRSGRSLAGGAQAEGFVWLLVLALAGEVPSTNGDGAHMVHYAARVLLDGMTAS
ncbi:MAG TPA: TetR/AcrR family transcriptional regulator [Acidimicrobiales bacterium]